MLSPNKVFGAVRLHKTLATEQGVRYTPPMLDSYLASDSREYLKLEFEMRHRRSQAYSLRAFARDLKMSPSSLSEFLHGKLGLSHQRVDHLATQMRLTEKQREHWHDLMDANWARDPVTKRQARMRIQKRVKDHPGRLDLQRFKVISDWFHFAILSAVDISPSFQKPALLAKALRLKVKTVNEAIQRLLDLNLLTSKNGKLVPSENSSFAGDECADEAIRESHRQVLQLANKALLDQDLSTRESCSVFVTLSSKHLTECREELRRATLNVLSKYTEVSREADRVAGFTMHLFEVCRAPENEEKE